jgi:hypothetical protein
MRATILVAAAREKENHGPTWSIVKQVEHKFAAQGHPVSLNTKTVNRYVRNDMVGCAPLMRGYEGAIPKAAFDLLVLAIESFIQIKQLNSKVIVRKQLLIVLNELCGIKSDIRVKENMLIPQHKAYQCSPRCAICITLRHTSFGHSVMWLMVPGGPRPTIARG